MLQLTKKEKNTINARFSENALKMMKKRYLVPRDDGTQETPADMFLRVAQDLAEQEKKYGRDEKFIAKVAKDFLSIMALKEYTPAGRTLTNAGSTTPLIANCIVLPIHDSMESIFQTLKDAALLQQAGSGLGFDLSEMRPAMFPTKKSRGEASGPVSFLKVYDAAFGTIKQQSRNGANMSMMRCLSGDTLIHTIKGKVKIQDLVGQRPYLYCTDGHSVFIRKATKVFQSGTGRKLVRVWFDDDSFLDCTPDHRIMCSDGQYKEAEHLELNDSVMAFHKRIINGYYRVGLTFRDSIKEHHAVAEMKYGVYPDQEEERRQSSDLTVHHVDGNKLNNDPDNIELLTIAEHARIHDEVRRIHRERIARERKGRTYEEVYGPAIAAVWKRKMSEAKRGRKPWNKDLRGKEYQAHYLSGFQNQYTDSNTNHKVVRVEDLPGVHDVYDISMPQLHNFVANGVFVHNCDHPDILDFITCKATEGEIRNFNITVNVTDEFMEQLEKNPDKPWLCSFEGKKMKPRKVSRHPNGSVFKSEETDITAKELFDMLVEHAWLNGEPGIGFIDTVNRSNPLPDLGSIQASNPCGEQYLHAYDNCNLGSLNLAAFVKNKKMDYKRLRFATRTAVRLMDNVIDKFDFPVKAVTELAQKNRRIGLGIMGFADMLYQLGVRYNSKQGFATAEKAMGFINKEAYAMSQELAKEKGSFPNYAKSIFGKKKVSHAKAQEWGMGKKMRNAALTTVAPTGSISMMLDASSGIEPNFALAYIKQDKDGHQYHYFNSYFKKALDKLKFSAKEQDKILKEVIAKGTIQHLENLPKALRDTFVVAMDIPGLDHMRMQASFQANVDNSISKTVNFPNEVTKEEVADTFMRAWKLGCKSCTVYRDGSRVIQILNVGSGENIVAPTEAPGKKSMSLVAEQGKPRPRPEVMSGNTYRIKTGYGKLYITVNNDEKGTPFEVFATIGKSGGFFQEQSEAICRLISLALRSGIAAGEVVEHLKGIRGPMPVFTDKGTVLSLPDALGKILEQHVSATAEVQEVISRPEKQEVLPFAGSSGKMEMADFGFMPGCPDCGLQLVMQEGCISCKACGFSRCS